jgi:hypothetical protein
MSGSSIGSSSARGGGRGLPALLGVPRVRGGNPTSAPRGGFINPQAPRPVTAATVTQTDATDGSNTSNASTAPAPAAVPMQSLPARPQVPWQIIQQIQEYLVQLAWQEVRAGVTMTVANQKNELVASFNRFALLFLDNSIPAGNDCYPTCPESLRTCSRTAAVALLNQSTSTGRASISKESMYRKAKLGVRKLLKYMGDWVRICKDTNTRAGQFTPSVPPSGTDRDHVWSKIKSTEHRSQQCLKIYNLRVQNSHLAENDPASIRESLTHLNFARRGYSLEEEYICRGRREENSLGQEEADIYDQIMQEVDSGHIAVASSDEEEAAPRPSVTSNAVSAVAPTRGYHEAPYDEIAGNYHPFEMCFKAFTQYAGHGHLDISGFYTSEWADQQRTQAAAGHVGRNHQRRQHAADLQQRSEAAHQTSSQTSVSTASTSATPVEQINELTAQMRLSNTLTRGDQVIVNLEKAIKLATDLKKPTLMIQRLQEQLLDLLMEDVGAGHAPIEQSRVSAPVPQRRRHFDTQQQATLHQIEEFASIVDNDGRGNCLFHVFEAIEEEYLEHIRLRPRQKVTFEELRSETVSILRANSATIRLAPALSLIGESFDIFVEPDMNTQRGSVREYCDWLARDGAPGR